MSYVFSTYLNQVGSTVSFYIPQTAAESAASVTPTNYEFPQGDVRRYGAVLDGVTDDTAALNRWASIGAQLIFPVAQTALISNSIALRSNTTITGCQGAIVQSNNPGASHFSGTSISNVLIENLKFYNSVTGSTAYIAGVALSSSNNCIIQNCEFQGMVWAGIYLHNSNYCTVTNNYFHSWINPTFSNCSDICVYENSSYNVVSNNQCDGNGWFGILQQDPYASSEPLKNVYIGNRVGQHQTYGIAVYQPDAVDTYTQIIGNLIENILGTQLSGSSGAGIYVLSAGAVVIQGNNIRNCCQNTSNRTLAPAAIGVSGIALGYVAPVISGNSIGEMNAYDGILVTACPTGATVTGNAITQPAANTTGTPIHVVNSNYVTVDNNQIYNAGNARNLMIEIANANLVQVSVSNNTLIGGAYAAISIERTSGTGTLTGGQFTANSISGQVAATGNGGIFAPSASLVNSVIANNYVVANTAPALTLGSPSGVTIAGNVLGTTGTKAFTTSGAGSTSYFDKNNVITSGVVSNAGTGVIAERLASAAPSTGTWAVGDRIVQSVPVVGNPMALRCTVAGSPGTWTSEGNLP